MRIVEKAILLTSNDLELDCIVISKKPLISGGEEVLVYAQNRIVRGYLEEGFVAELNIIINYAIIPELDNELQSYISF